MAIATSGVPIIPARSIEVAAGPEAGGGWAGPRADLGPALVFSLNDPALIGFLQDGLPSSTGITISTERAMRNPAVFRCVSLISQSIGMLPLHLMNSETKDKAKDVPLYKVLHRRPNAWQTAYEFRTLMQQWALTEGDAYARIIRSRDFRRREDTIVGLVPLGPPSSVTPIQNGDFTLSYRHNQARGGTKTYAGEEIFHLRGGISRDGIRGTSLVKQAADAIGLALAADLALGRLYKNGSFVNGYLTHPKTLSDPAIERLRANWDSRFAGAENAGNTPLFEEGLKYELFGSTAKDAQSHETRGRQVEEIARIFGTPRPLLMIDETSWGSGIDVLGQFFVRYGLNPWFEAWQQAIERDLLTEKETETLEAKFNAGGLLRGSMTQQADFFAKALGAGGQQPFMTPNEAREWLDMPAHPDGNKLLNPMTQTPAGANANDNGGTNG